MHSRAVRLLPFLLLFFIAGCATLRGGGDENSILLQVQNDLIPPTTLSVYAVPEVGARRLVGIVRPNRTTTLRMENAGADTYQFVAQTTAGQEIVSPQTSLAPGGGAQWSISNNLITPL